MLENTEDRASLINDLGFQIILNPDIQFLRRAYFVSVHAEAESIWEEVLKLIPNEGLRPLNNKYFDSLIQNRTFFIHDIVYRNQILFKYNYIRNKIMHGGKLSDAKNLSEMEICIKNKEICGLGIEKSNVDRSFHFIIENLDFIALYKSALASFYLEIIDVSHKSRKLPLR